MNDSPIRLNRKKDRCFVAQKWCDACFARVNCVVNTHTHKQCQKVSKGLNACSRCIWMFAPNRLHTRHIINTWSAGAKYAIFLPPPAAGDSEKKNTCAVNIVHPRPTPQMHSTRIASEEEQKKKSTTTTLSNRIRLIHNYTIRNRSSIISGWPALGTVPCQESY